MYALAFLVLPMVIAVIVGRWAARRVARDSPSWAAWLIGILMGMVTWFAVVFVLSSPVSISGGSDSSGGSGGSVPVPVAPPADDQPPP